MKFIVVIGIGIIGFSCISCSPKAPAATVPQALEAFVNNHVSDLPMVAQIRTLKSEELGIPGGSAAREQFISAYSGFLIDYKRIIEQYRSNASVTRFAAMRYRDAVLEKRMPLAQTMVNRADNSLYVGFALLTGTGIDYDAIGNRQYVRQLARQYAISDVEIENGLWELLTRDWDEVLAATVTMIRTNIEAVLSGDRRAFVANVMQPYFVLLSRDRTIPADAEKTVFESFDALFPPKREGARSLEIFVKAFKRSRISDARFSPADVNAFNRHLEQYGFLADLEPEVSIWYQVAGSPVATESKGIGDLLMCRRVGVVLPVEGEIAPDGRGSDIMLSYDDIAADAGEITAALGSDTIRKAYGSDDNALWNSIGCRMRADRADSLRHLIVRKSFSEKSMPQVFPILARNAAIRGLKRKWDVLASPKTDFLNVDADFSAYIAAAVYGDHIAYGLLEFVNRMQWYCRDINDTHVRSTLQPIVIEGWKLVQETAEGKTGESDLRKRLIALYDSVVLLRGGKLPPLETFETTVLRSVTGKISEFSL
jgi:hypothetical protein